jgi:hypothetical protein
MGHVEKKKELMNLEEKKKPQMFPKKRMGVIKNCATFITILYGNTKKNS